MACYYCENGQSTTDYHKSCLTEFNVRSREGRCLRCGVSVGCVPTESAKTWCPECNHMHDPPYVGYPGGV